MVARLMLFSALVFFFGVQKISAKPGSGKNSINADSLADQWDQLLKKYLDPKTGRVNYIGLDSVGRSDLEKLLSGYSALDIAPLSQDERKAVYINLYNAGMMYNLLRYVREKEKYTVADKKFLSLEVNDISVPGGDIWNGDYRFKLAGHKVTLNHIEHGLIRGDKKEQFPEGLTRFVLKKLDPRIHAAVNCAALSCPRVREKAYRGSNINQMLDENMKEWFANPEQFKKLSSSKLHANKIVYWYYQDFDEHGRKVLKLKGAGDYLSKFISDETNDGKWMKAHLKKSFNNRNKFWGLKVSNEYSFEYDWKVNDQRQ